MREQVKRYEFTINIQIYDTRRRANKVRDALYELIENWSMDYGDTVRGMTVDVESLKIAQPH